MWECGHYKRLPLCKHNKQGSDTNGKVNRQTETEATMYGEAVIVDVHYANNRPADEYRISAFERLLSPYFRV